MVAVDFTIVEPAEMHAVMATLAARFARACDPALP
jgi:hypothetical protein